MAAQFDLRYLDAGLLRLVKPLRAESASQILPPRAWQDLFGLLITLLTLVLVAKLAIPHPLPTPTLLPEARCDLQHESCRLSLPGNLQLELRLVDGPVQPNQAFNVEIRHADAAIQPLSQEIRGVEIEMGSPSAHFSSAANGIFRSPAHIPLCTVQRMNWRLVVRLEAHGHQYAWPLLFQTESNV